MFPFATEGGLGRKFTIYFCMKGYKPSVKLKKIKRNSDLSIFNLSDASNHIQSIPLDKPFSKIPKKNPIEDFFGRKFTIYFCMEGCNPSIKLKKIKRNSDLSDFQFIGYFKSHTKYSTRQTIFKNPKKKPHGGFFFFKMETI